MKILIDENLPKRIKSAFLGWDIYTIKDMEWQGKQNGELMKLMFENSFNVLFTFDKNMQYQQYFPKFCVTVFVLNASTNQYKSVEPLLSAVKIKLIEKLPYEAIIISPIDES